MNVGSRSKSRLLDNSLSMQEIFVKAFFCQSQSFLHSSTSVHPSLWGMQVSVCSHPRMDGSIHFKSKKDSRDNLTLDIREDVQCFNLTLETSLR